MTFPERLRAQALLPLWRALHDRFSSGKQVTRVRVGPLDDTQRSAIADLLGMTRYPGEYATVQVATLDKLLGEAVGLDTRAAVTELVGPLQDRAARRAEVTEQRTRLWEWLANHEIVAAQPVLREWAERERRGGLMAGSVEKTQALLESALRVLGALPARGTPLPAFADEMLGDPHALDDGTRLAGLVLRALATLYGTDTPADSRQRRTLWSWAGVTDDELSSTVVAAGLRPHDDTLAGTILRHCAESGHAGALTLAQLRAVDTLTVPHPDVWIVENPSVLTLALRRFTRYCPPIVCTSGWPNSAGITLLRLLAESGARLHYHGDFDGEGLRIAAYVLDKTGATPWRMSTADYLAAVSGQQPGPEPGRITDAPWDDALATALREHRSAVPEERVAEVLLDELH